LIAGLVAYAASPDRPAVPVALHLKQQVNVGNYRYIRQFLVAGAASRGVDITDGGYI
jgi:hypothetical protein